MTIETNTLRPYRIDDFVDEVRRLYPDLKVETAFEEYCVDEERGYEQMREVCTLYGEADSSFIDFMKKWEYTTAPIVWEVTYLNEYVRRKILLFPYLRK